MKRKIALTSLALLSAVATVTLSPTAQADNSRCPANRFCLFEHIDFGGGRAVFSGDDSNLSDNHYDNNHVVNNTSSSMINNTGRIVVLYDGFNQSSSIYGAAKESEDKTFVNNNANDRASSLDFI